jgi:aminopeptidase N
MEGDARSTTHPIQQPIANEAEANSAFDDITYQKGQSLIRMLESFIGEDTFRDGIRRYIAAHKYSNSTTADLWSALADASGKPINEIAAGWTEQPGFPVVKVRQDEGGKVALFQERFAINYKNPRPLEWKIPLTYAVVGQPPATRLMTSKTETLDDVPPDQPFKLNLDDTGYYRTQYDPKTWDRLVGALSQLSLGDRVNLLSDAWALVQSNRSPFAIYTGLVAKLPDSADLPQWDQVSTVVSYIDRLLIDQPGRHKFQQYARSVLRPVFDQIGWDSKPDEPPNIATLRGRLIELLGQTNDPDIIATCRERFQMTARDPRSVSPDIRRAVLSVIAHSGNQTTWEKLHELGLNTTVIAEKEDYYDALAHFRDPRLIQKTLALALTDELSASRAAFLPGKVALSSDHPDIAWDFAKANMKALLGKVDSGNVNSYATSLFTFFSDPARAAELKEYAKSNLPPTSGREVAKAVDEVEFRSVLKRRIANQLDSALPANE